MTSPTTSNKASQDTSSSSVNSATGRDTSTTTTSTTTAALYGILPAVASTMCCWGPPLLSVVGAGSAGSLINHHIARYRPYLLGLSATMIGYSFTRVYPDVFSNIPILGGTSNQQNRHDDSTAAASHSCCADSDTAPHHPHDPSTTLRIQRAVVWTSAAVAVAGAFYGRQGAGRSFLRQMASRANRTSPPPPPSGASSGNTSVNPTSPLVLHVDGMACAGCANRVQNAIWKQQPTVTDVSVNHKTGRTLVQGVAADDTSSLASLRQAIEKAGYQVRQQ